ncbi:polyphosphate polymerase domain-containing protein [Crocinitomix catalasitica]|uniref:polyphosphate polymerase domain-containing protein n=1 Tax=Crocinitomix catalasitica TaxID=184607 RepID=UPI0004880585|nr:polyphosphate polymerase domain-containing protein [Crocinitomix catalasitica]
MSKISSSFSEVLSELESINLTEMDAVRLMNRTDTKFVFSQNKLGGLLKELSKDYKVLEINGNKVSNYKTLYFDTKNFDFFLEHHNGKANRYKIRIRQYIESNLFFLEIKHKFKGRTDKVRIPINDFEEDLSTKSKAFIFGVLEKEVSLEPKLWNSFSRITLVNKHEKERLTFDLGVQYSIGEKKVAYDHLVIAELKQEKLNRLSTFYKLMKEKMIRPYSISKYCVGSIGLYPELKYNNFKSKLIFIDKID